MKISLKWINDFVDIKDQFAKPENLANLLTAAGLEVEEIHNKAKEFENVVVGLILQKDKHPDAEKLSLCQVTTGDGIVHQIVCGAKNHKAEDKVIVALPGAVLPGNFQIKKSVIRGVESGGMLCSYKELGLADTSDGIAILPVDAPVGKAYAEYSGADDIVFELKVTPNRADCLSHYGLAREIACLLDRPIKAPNLEFKTSSQPTREFVQIQMNAQVDDGNMCPRYTGRVIRNVKVGPSPTWLVKRLDNVGMKSINNIVDITNYVMLELGQPLHAFDLSQVSNRNIVVAPAQPGEKFVTLDGTELTLSGNELMIRDSQRSLCMAGVIGGKNSGVSETTTEVFLESAFFAPQFVRKASRQHGAITDSAYRFSRGVDPVATLDGLTLASKMIHEIAGGEVSTEPMDLISPELANQKRAAISLSVELVSDRLGYKVENTKLENFMVRLGCRIEKNNENYLISPPSWRFDIENEMDLVEEYARLNGYANIPETFPPLTTVPANHDRNYVLHGQVISQMIAMGYSQAINMAFVSDNFQKKILGESKYFEDTGLSVPSEAIKLVNPLSEDSSVMRTSLVPGLIKNLNHNFHHGVENGRLFEVGHIFAKKAGEASGNSYQQLARLSGALWGQTLSLWNKGGSAPAVLELKGAIESLLESLSIKNYEWIKPVVQNSTSARSMLIPGFLHQRQVAYLKVEGQKIGYIGTLHPVLVDELKLRVDCAVFELDLDQLTKGQPRGYRVEGVSKMQVVYRDLALVMPQKTEVGLVAKEMLKKGGVFLKSVNPFDIYKGENLDMGKKSVTFRLMFQNPEATLTEVQIAEIIEKMIMGIKETNPEVSSR